MPIRLINPEATKTIDVDGTKIEFRALNGAERLQVSLLFKANADGTMTGNFGAIAKVIAPAIKSIEGFEDKNPLYVLTNLSESEHLGQIFGEIYAYSQLSGDEIKNSGSSSDTPASSPAGDAKSAT